MFAGTRISYTATDGDHVARIQENEECTEFLCEFEGREVRVKDMVPMARAIMEHASNGNVGPLVKLVRWNAFLQEFGLSITSDSTRLDLTRKGVLQVPASVSAEMLERATYHDGSRVAKLLFTLRERNHWLYGMFRNHEYAVALVGVDEIGQPWMHFLPPVYRESAISDCEVWLAGGAAGDNLVF